MTTPQDDILRTQFLHEQKQTGVWDITKREMSDDKAGEGPYDHIDAASGEWCVFNCPKCAYDKGRKAERERCADIARKYASCEGIAQEIEKKILGGQDGE